ncbi:mycothiol synthase [Nostocoides sp. HKS02]|uniref:mycothiol synthase n=1 Tax=Nostocoides sp. HKS02 TaxID=1813880 RepID=UPI0012B4BED3|nr:mycothiol synthase [Tetrasphaera sp. HKS02]QGN58927.1 mycothiol synthase [Tetrasphaera sp. HKS02]
MIQCLPCPHHPSNKRATLTPETAEQVRDLSAAAARTDGVAPLSEQTLLWLGDAEGRATHLLTYAEHTLTGYAQLAELDPAEPSAEVVVDPAHRRHGLGRALLETARERSPLVRVWAHGNLEPARSLAATDGWTAVRELHKMSRPLSAADTDPARSALPPGFAARAFEPGRDEQAWLEANAAAFVHHAEQGRMTLADLREREAQPWFDPAGLLLVEAQDAPGRVVAFHWTKVDPSQASSVDPGAAAGEVYVVGVHPAYQGKGLGRPVTALGLAHLAAQGLPEVVLYVDGDNEPAIRTYTGLGFRSIMVDVMYSHPVHQALSG